MNSEVLKNVATYTVGIALIALSVLAGLWQWFILHFEPYLVLPGFMYDLVDQRQLQTTIVPFILALLLMIPVISLLSVSISRFVGRDAQKLDEEKLSSQTLLRTGMVTLDLLKLVGVFLIVTLVFLIVLGAVFFTFDATPTYVVLALLYLFVVPGLFYAFISAFATSTYYRHKFFGSFIENLELFFTNYGRMWPFVLIGYIGLNVLAILLLIPGFYGSMLFELLGGGIAFILVYAIYHFLISALFAAGFSILFYSYGFAYFYLISEESSMLSFNESISKKLELGSS